MEMFKNKLIVVEDDPATRLLIRSVLFKSGYQVLEANSGEQALELCACEGPILVVLDIGLPGMDGFEVCRTLRASGRRQGILMLTAKEGDQDKVEGLDAGADDYMVKPFNPRELVARVKAVLRRLHPLNSSNEPLLFKGLRLEPENRRVFRDGLEVRLTPREFNLLSNLLKASGRAMSREELTDALWGINHFGSPKLLDVYVRRLREKIETDPSAPQLIQTVWGYGYACR
ncbi:MAG: two component transcriptional regulator, winged helix family [Holophagaceae bacterium]|nr:two component transcriptional regulator, winged helix family [Holophagaceae bacterium]